MLEKVGLQLVWVLLQLMEDWPVSVAILEAEGELNREVQSALQQFRSKLLANASPIKKEVVEPYESNKEGPEKVFVFRESLLSLMFEINDFRTIYNMLMASFIILTFSLFYDSYVATGQVVDLRELASFFYGMQTVCVAWVVLLALFFTIIPLMKLALRCSACLWVPLYVAYMAAIMTVATRFSQSEGLGFGSIMIIMPEAVRMLMKAHSYLRTKIIYLKDTRSEQFEFRGVRVINLAKGKSEDGQKEQNEEGKVKEGKEGKFMRIVIKNEDVFGEIKKLSYFLFAPTLIYRDEYTLTPVRSTQRMLAHLINILACIYYVFMLYVSWCKPVIADLENNLSVAALSSAIINLMLPSVLFLVLGFFGFLHSWLNLWSQITRFPDRAFYSDWWNSCEFGSYYRKWNIVVHDWLYYYIYLDLMRLAPVLRRSKGIPQLVTFVISAIIHEVIIYYAIGFFYPILFLLFAGPGILFVQISSLRKTSVNLIFWLEMYIGTSIMFSLYLIECFARNRISTQLMEQEWGSLAFIIPRTLYLGRS